MTKKLLKHKGPDGKWVTVASYEIGDRGPRVGINKPLARQLLEGDGWLNLAVFESDREGPARQESAPAGGPPPLEEIPFMYCWQ